MIIEESCNDFKVKLQIENFKDSEELVLVKSVRLMAKALGDLMFEDYCLDYEYQVKTYRWVGLKKKYYYKTYKGFYNVEGLTQKQVYDKIMKGEEVLSEDGEDKEADIFLRIDRSYKPGVIGYTHSGSKYQYIFQRIIRNWDYTDVAANLAHEWCHKLGFSHYKVKKSRKYRTCPYAVGTYVRNYLKLKNYTTLL